MTTPIFPVLPLEDRDQHIALVKTEFHRRWTDVNSKKSHFAGYFLKSEVEILQEFQKLHTFRINLWYRNPTESPHICQKDYKVAQDLLEKGYYRAINNIAFAYNRTDSTYNASTILVDHHHFIALQEPNAEILPLFFKFLMNHQVSVLIRLKPESEYQDVYSVKYWQNRMEHNPDKLKVDLTHSGKTFEPIFIPYFATETWEDDKADTIDALYSLVKRVKEPYQKLKNKGPLACHCTSGVGRTGTFMAAMILADKIENAGTENLSIEELVLKLSLQRPNMVATPEQYLMLYRFVDFYIKKL